MKHWHQDTKCSVYHFVLILKATFCLYSKCTNHGKNKHLKTHEMVWQVFIPGGYAFSVETRHLVRAYQRVCLFSNSATFMICVVCQCVWILVIVNTLFFPSSCVQVQPQPDAKMCDQTFLAITFGPCDNCSQNKPLMNIYLKNEPINYCSLCVELVCYPTL